MGDGVWAGGDNDDSSSSSFDNADNKVRVRTGDRIRSLVTVGAVHRPPAVNPSKCVTRGALAYTDETYPGAFLKESQGIGYVSVGGNAITGENTKYEKITDADKLYATRGEGSASRVAYTSYEAVCGKGNVDGDGVVPLEWTLLEGSQQVRLDGVLHSINEAGTTIPTDRWYGSDAVIDRWLPIALEEAGIPTNNKGQSSPFDLAGLQKWASELFQD